LFISVDPGENVGVATFREDGSDINKSIMRLENFRSFLKMVLAALPQDERMRFIMEDYSLRQDMAIAQTGSDMPASRCIGAVEMISTLLGERSMIFLQKPGNLRGALKWAGYPELARKPRSWHCPDDISAYAHGVHRLIDLKLRKHPIFE
jgi:hypothetical protein